MCTIGSRTDGSNAAPITTGECPPVPSHALASVVPLHWPKPHREYKKHTHGHKSDSRWVLLLNAVLPPGATPVWVRLLWRLLSLLRSLAWSISPSTASTSHSYWSITFASGTVDATRPL